MTLIFNSSPLKRYVYLMGKRMTFFAHTLCNLEHAFDAWAVESEESSEELPPPSSPALALS